VFRDEALVFFQVQTFREDIDQLRVEGQRTSFKDDRRFDIESLCKSADRLFGDRVEEGEGDISFCDSLV